MPETETLKLFLGTSPVAYFFVIKLVETLPSKSIWKVFFESVVN